MRDEPVYTEEYNGYTINIYQDDTGMPCPFDDWDCEPPIAVAYDRQITEHSTQYGYVNSVPSLTRDQMIANRGAVLEILDEPSWFRVVDRTDLSWGQASIEDLINDALSEMVDGMTNSDRLEALAELYRISGVPALCKSVHGYNQGDYAEVLAVATPKFQQACGNKAGYWDDIAKLEPSIQLYQDWAFGNVYGYDIEADDFESSCWGFYGDYDSEDGVLAEARSQIDYHVAWINRPWYIKVKDWAKRVWRTRQRRVA